MEFYLGGYGQGKLRHVMRLHQGEALTVIDGACGQTAEISGRPVLNHFHLWVKRIEEEGANPAAALAEFLDQYPDCIVISDEVGGGVVPVSQTERDYRELVGRLQIELAARAERVERVLCGIGQRLK